MGKYKDKSITSTSPAPGGRTATMHSDGSCPANPGPMGIGYLIDLAPEHDGATGFRIECGYRLGEGTNNRAEYLALIFGLREALRHGVVEIAAHSDSLLIVNQVCGKWKCGDKSLLNLQAEAQGLLTMFNKWSLKHIYREDNDSADFLSKNPTEPTLPLPLLVVDMSKNFRRKMNRYDAARIQWWWRTRRCQNEYRLTRLFKYTESYLGKIGRGELYEDIMEFDLKGPLS